jgi:hypothetical protein
MFGPVRGPWPDETWRGWWGENPVYHTGIDLPQLGYRCVRYVPGARAAHVVLGKV